MFAPIWKAASSLYHCLLTSLQPTSWAWGLSEWWTLGILMDVRYFECHLAHRRWSRTDNHYHCHTDLSIIIISIVIYFAYRYKMSIAITSGYWFGLQDNFLYLFGFHSSLVKHHRQEGEIRRKREENRHDFVMCFQNYMKLSSFSSVNFPVGWFIFPIYYYLI